ncbi:MAG: hypothetical protein LQ342_004443 [Letrouitia transgressa]|nr:MAG: hypothetical protein LQ342_004443 [Letrouitia transgressa]
MILLLLQSFTTACELGPGEESHTVGGNKSGSIWPWQIYQSAPYNPPELDINSNGEALAEGLLLFTPSNFRPINSVKESAPLIMTDQGQLVWNGPIGNVTNLRATVYEGSPVLTYWAGLSTEGGNVGHGYGNVIFLDTSYREILTVCPKFGLVIPEGKQYPCEADFHESFVTDRNTLLVSAYNATPADLSVIGGPRQGWIFDCIVFEIDPKSQEILFRWSAFEHVPISQTKYPLQGTGNKTVPFDYFHVNSIVYVGESFLVNSRHTWSTYLISAKGEIQWTLQGDTGGDFGSLPDEGRFKWQHHAVAHGITNSSISISYFNNFASAPDNGSRPSHGLELQLSLPPDKLRSPQVVQYVSDPTEPIYDKSQGSTQILENRNVFLDFGQIPIMKEFSPGYPSNNAARWTARFGRDNRVQSYRGFKQQWHATPSYPPNLVVKQNRTASRCVTGYVSWNGATDVTAWEIWEGSDQKHLSKTGRIYRRGFETKFRIKETCAQAVALQGEKVASKSRVACAS